MDEAGETNARVAGTTPRTGRLRVLAVLAALGLLYFPGLGAVDLASAIVGLPSRDELVGMRAAYGLVVGFLLRPRCSSSPPSRVACGRHWSAVRGCSSLARLWADSRQGTWAFHVRHPMFTFRC